MRKILLCIVLLGLAGGLCAGSGSLDAYRKRQGEMARPAVRLARETVRIYLATGKRRAPAMDLPEVFKRSAPVFVTISKQGRRVGCKGAFEPVAGNLRDEIVRAAIGAATADRRYRPIRAGELKDMQFTVSIIGPLKRVADPASYPPGRFGLLLRSGAKSGVLLPGEAKTSAWRLAEARRQAGVGRSEPCEFYVFEAVSLHERKDPPRSGRGIRAKHR